MIKRMLKNLCKNFGSRLIVDGNEFFTFPSARSIYRATTGQLKECGLGYRVKALKAVAEKLVVNDIDTDSLKSKKISYEDAKEQLLDIYGIGNKIADCILLFSLDKLEAFPIDVWIARALKNHYSWLYKEEPSSHITFTNRNLKKQQEQQDAKIKVNEKLTLSQYITLSRVIRNYFGEASGYAQQYIYYHMRETAGKKW
jgi:N-glycosylase/DNA lyase